MEVDNGSSSDSEYLPGDSEDEVSDVNDDSDESDIEELSDSELVEETEPLEDAGWKFMSDIFSDARPRALPEFSDQGTGISALVPEFLNPREAFCYFFDKEMVDKLCSWMNARAVEYFTATGKVKVNGLIWHQVTPDDMYVFISLLLVMGVVKLPRMHMYWSHTVQLGAPGIFCKEVMSRARFLCTLKFLRFSLPADVEKKRPKTRIESYLTLLRTRSQTLMKPEKHIAVDEALMLWKGRLGFRQFIKTKRSRFGIKVFVLCPSDPGWNGYSWNFEVYYGKDTDFAVDDPAASHLSISEVIVVHLMKDLLDSGRHVVTDNWYTSLRLCNYLETRDTLLTGVVRSGRGPPKKMMEEKLEKHQAVFARKGNTLLVKYQDKKAVTVLSTLYNAGIVEKAKTFFGDKTVFFNKPLHIDRYNSLMGSVDMADQLLEPYSYEKKSLAWFKKLGIHFMFRCLLNSFLVYRNQTKYKGDFLKFIITVSEELSCKHSKDAKKLHQEEKERKRQRPVKKVPKEDLIHAWVRHQPKRQKMCRICYKDGARRKDTVYYCPGCPGQPGLCSMEHFTAWHRDIPQPRKSPKQTEPGPSGQSSRKKRVM